jgi:quinol monooxygenase YgiN
MGEPLIFFDTSTIAEGELENVEAAMKELASFVVDNEPSVISYNVFFSADRRTVTVVQTHPDAASMERHMEIAAHLFRPLAGALTMRQMDVYGRPSAKLLDLMQKKAEMLGAPGVGVHEHHAGFTR